MTPVQPGVGARPDLVSNRLEPDHFQKDIFNVCTGVGHSINEIISIVESVSGEKLDYSYAPANPGKESVGDNKKVLNVLGYGIEYDLQKGLEKTYKNYQKPLLT